MPRRASGHKESAPLKRALPSSATTPTRQSKRVKSSPITSNTVNQTTPKKSKYFEQDSEPSEAESEIVNEASGYEDEDESVSAVSSPSESADEDEEEDEEYASAEDIPTKKRGRPRRKSNNDNVVVVSKSTKGQELWRPGVKTDLAPGEAMFIKLPKAREAGNTPYESDTIHPNTLAFLGDLKENNDREWLKVHDADYRQSQKDFNSFVESLTEKVIERDETIPELPPKDLTFRIYRDVRFSSDPTPYKTHYSAAWSRTGRKGPYAGYYLQIAPSGSFVGAGLWQPEAPPLALMRRAIDRKSDKLKAVLLERAMRKEFLKGAKEEEKAIVKAFVEMNKGNMLKTKPKGYSAENPNIALLRLRNFTIGRKLRDDEILGAGAIGRIANLIGILTPFVTYLNSVIMPDEEESEDSGGEEEEEEEGQE